MDWWRPQVEGALSDAERAIAGAHEELDRLGGWKNDQLGEALHELIHAGDALADLRSRLGLVEGQQL